MKTTFLRMSCFAVVIIMMIAVGCEGPKGPAGQAPVDKGSISGTVTDSGTGSGITGATVAASSAQATTDSAGNFTIANLSVGVYKLTASATGYNPATSDFIGIIAGQTQSVNLALSKVTSPNNAPTVSLVSQYQVGFGSAANLTAVASDPDNDPLSYSWTVSDAEGNSVTTGTSSTISFNTPTFAAAYGPLTNRFGLIGLSPTNQSLFSVKVTVSDGRGGTASATGTVTAASKSGGIRNIPIGLAIYLNSGHSAGNTWTCSTPSGALCTAAEFSGGNTQTPRFAPDIIGGFTFTESGTPPTVNTTNIYTGSWLGIGTASAQANCTVCHNDTIAPACFDDWTTSLHSVMAKQGLDGFRSSYYNSSCLVCHTVGNDPAASNGGFDDITGWTFPSVLQPGTFDSQPAAVQQLANIQCENCHGPQTGNGAGGYTLAHKMTSPTITPDIFETARVSHNPDVCFQCHDEPPFHTTGKEWKGSGHANLALARQVGTGSSSCARCHSSQGFVHWLDQQQNDGNPGSIVNFNAIKTDLGLTDTLIQPQVCAACHDPMMNMDNPAALANASPEQNASVTSSPNHHQVRVVDNTLLLPAGYSASGMGMGAVCMMCHNTRNGVLTSADFGTCVTGGTFTTYLHEDGACGMTGPASYPAPHVAAQADILNGHNAYFTTAWLPNGTSFLSKHENVKDTCVGCHMALNPNGMHAFTINDSDRPTLCANCHGLTSGDALVAQVKDLMDQLGTQIEGTYQTKIGNSAAAGDTVTVTVVDIDSDCNSTTAIQIATPTTVQLVEIHGQYGLTLTLPSTVTINSWKPPSGKTVAVCPITPTTTDTVSFQVGTLMTQATSFDPNANKQSYNLILLNDPVIRKNWNFYLFESDSSFGIHNPTFVVNTLKATIAAP